MESLMEMLEREMPESVVIPAEVVPAPVEEPDPLEEEVLNLADRAKETFGYTALSRNIRAKRQKKVEEREATDRKLAEERKLAHPPGAGAGSPCRTGYRAVLKGIRGEVQGRGD